MLDFHDSTLYSSSVVPPSCGVPLLSGAQPYRKLQSITENYKSLVESMKENINLSC
jgi:hypothetical protein